MAGTGDLIDFNVIESHKENIEALPSGRSAKALAQLYSPPLLASPSTVQDAHAKERIPFEKELALIDEADDPLDVYDRYVRWTLDAYPSPQAKEAQLLPLLERATKSLQASKHYRNDPRYLKLWLHYIRLFSDAPREIFSYLARHSIGESLALYYEEFAAWLENAGRWNQAEEIYKMGLEKEARPAERLMRKFGEFERRKEARPEDAAEPTSPALPKARPALAARIDPFAASSPTAEQQQQARSTAPKKSKSSKMAIFSDTSEESSRPNSGSSSKGWDNIGSLTDRKKENTVEAKPWAGEKLKGGKTNTGMQKLMIFKDESSKRSSRAASHMPLPSHIKRSLSGSTHEQQCVPNPKTGRMECVFVNLEAVYPQAGRRMEEYCFEELRAKRRGWLDKKWERPKAQVLQQPEPDQEDEAMDLEPEELVQEPMKLNIHVDQPAEQPKKKQRGFEIFEDVPTDQPATAPSAPPSKSRIEDLPMEQPEKKSRGFEIFEDAAPTKPARTATSAREEKVLANKFAKALTLNDENDENAALKRPKTVPLNDENGARVSQKQQEADIAKRMRREERQNRTRNIKVMDVKHIENETKTIQLNMDSPKGPKIKRKKSSDRGAVAEPTMTINTKEAMDEIYDIFNQPLPSTAEQTDGEEEDSEDEYTTDGESTATGKLSAAGSEYGDETKNELLGASVQKHEEDGQTNTGWSDFTTSKHVPKDSSAPQSAQSTTWDVYEDPTRSGTAAEEEVVTPQDENPRTQYVPVPPEDYEPPSTAYHQPMLPNHRLPFMTPIVEQTESSLGAATGRTEKDYFTAAKTPSRKLGAPLPEQDELNSSPFQEVIPDMAEEKRKVMQPIRTKTTKGTISLGAGSAKSQIAAKNKPASAPEPVQKGPLVKDEQCNPMDPVLRQSILAQMKPSLTSYEGYHEHLDQSSGRTAEIKKYIRTLQKPSRSSVNVDKTAQTLSLPPMLRFTGTEATYTVKRELGAGTFAPVYLVENSAAVESGAQDENRPPSRGMGKSAHRKPLEAVKMEEPPSTWEFYILRQSHRRLGVSRAAESIVRAHEMHLFRDECFLIEEYRDQGTLLDLVNLSRAENSSGGMDETLAMFLTVELLHTVEAMHSKQLIHGDLKADNILVRFDHVGEEVDWCPTYFPSGAHGWSAKGVTVIDFGRGIDMKHFIPNVAFIADWKTSEADCAEMRELRPWTYQIDYHGLAGIIHSMLFGKYMETIGEKGGALGHGATKTYRIRESLKRYWQTDIWSEVFALLLNPLGHLEQEEGKKMPVLKGMRHCRERMEGWLEENCERGVGLKGMIGRMEAIIREKRRRSTKSAA